jgi:VWFA-related protein
MKKEFLIALATLLWFSSAALGQQSSYVAPYVDSTLMSNSSDVGLSTLVVEVELINVPLTIKDNRGQLVSSIDPAQLKLFEDDRLQTIAFFSKETNLPLYIGLLIDSSNSIAERFTFETQTAANFLKNSAKKGHDKAFLMTFNSKIDLLEDFTDDPSLVLQALEKIRPRGATRFYDAMVQACLTQMAPLEGRKALVVISDGDDNASELGWKKVLRSAHSADVTIYTISTHPHSRGSKLEKPGKILSRLAEGTGGQAFFPADSQEFASSFDTISRELRSQFSLAYRSSNSIQDGSFRKIKIESPRKDWVLRAKKGYYSRLDSVSLANSGRLP